MRQEEFLEQADRYLFSEMNEQEKKAFEDLCQSDEQKNIWFTEHKDFLEQWKYHQDRLVFKEQVHHILDQQKPSLLLRTWRILKINAVAAAAVAVISSLATLYLTGYFSTLKQASSDYSALKREVNTVKANMDAHQNAISILGKKQQHEDPSLQYGATGFLLTHNGYAVTNFHVVNGADSIYLQNRQGQSFKASVIHTDPKNDLAILHISDSSFISSSKIPYTFGQQDSDLGEKIYTIGYPRDEAVYGEGYLSSATGYSGDTSAYQISVPVNPGNSGGPLLDQHGQIIGIISGKQKGIDGAAFAIKTKALLESIEHISADSLDSEKIVLNKKNSLARLPRTQQIKKIQDFIYMVKVY